jgi:Beta-propeller repeat
MSKDRPLSPCILGAVVALVSSTLLLWGPAWGAVDNQSKVRLQECYGKLPLHFIVNQGQVNARVKYYTQGGGYAFCFSPEGVALNLPGGREGSSRDWTPDKGLCRQQPLPRRLAPKTVVQLQPVGIGPGVKLTATEPRRGRVNYFIGNNPEKWRTGIPTYGAVVYTEAYPGIDLKFYGNGRQLEYDLMVRPGADPSRVKFQYQGIEGLTVTREGDLAVRLPNGESLVQKKPVVYQEIAGQRVAREGKFKILENTSRFIYGFEVVAYDPHHLLVIDPALVYSTYLGGSFYDEGSSIAADGLGRAYVTGYTYSIDPPTITQPLLRLFPELQSQDIPDYANSIVFVTRIKADGKELDYATFLGGGTETGFDDDSQGNAIAVDAGYFAYVAGGTMSANFPTTPGVYQRVFGGGNWDAFVCKLDADGNLLYSTFLGGNGLDIARGIATDRFGNAYVTGKTFSTNFPATNQSKNGGGGDAFVACLSTNGKILNYSTYLGGSGDDAGNGIAVDGSGNAYVAGATNSRNFPTTYKAGGTGDYDVFVTKFGFDGTRGYSMRLGGSQYDSAQAVAVDNNGHAYVTGYTYSGTGFPGTRLLQAAGVSASENSGGGKKVAAAAKGGKSQPTADAFVTRLNLAGNGLDYSVLLGGSKDDVGYGIAVDSSRCAYVTGGTQSVDFVPPLTALIGHGGGRDAFVIKLNSTGTMADFSVSLAGNGDEEGIGIAVDGQGYSYVTGYTYSTNLATVQDPPVLQPFLNNPGGTSNGGTGVYDGFVARISDTP